MRQDELTCPFPAPESHPYVACMVMDSVQATIFRRMVAEQDDVTFLGINKDDPQKWKVYAGCRSESVRVKLEDSW